MKEIVISLIIVVGIISLDMMVQNYTEKSINGIINQLEDMSVTLKNTDNSNIEQQCQKLEIDWEGKKSQMAYFIEHNELEKVENNITSMKSYIETGENNLAINEIKTNIFILKHIKDKYRLSLENIF